MAARNPFRNVIVLGIMLASVLLVPGAMNLYVDWLWFQELSLTTVFTRELTTKLALLFGVGAICFATIYLNLRLAQRTLSVHPVRLQPAANQEPVDLTVIVQRLTLVFALAFALMTGLASTGNWLGILQFMNARPFGTVDPVLGRDIGFYIFSLPVLNWAISLATSIMIITVMSLVAVYWARGELILLPRRFVLEPAAGIHVGILVALVFVLVALRTMYVSIPELLFSQSEQLAGASYTDIHVRLPALRFTAFIALASAAFVAWGAVKRRTIFHTALAAVAYVVVSAIGLAGVPALVQRFVVAPTELTREQPQILHHIAATRRAWDLDSVSVRDIQEHNGLTSEDLRRNASTIENVRLWDRDPLLQTFGQLQEIRTYYDFRSVDDDRYMIDGRYRQVLLSARELNSRSLPIGNFINVHLTFTHGMGLTLGPVNQVTSEGLPVLFIKDVPPASSVSLKVTRPQIYFGELTTEFAIVNTKQAEFDYPAGERDETTNYRGKAGIPLGSFFRKLLFATHFQQMNLMLSNDVTSESRILIRREITSRARAAFPFLRFDADPYLLLDDDGTLKWIMDAYTMSSWYPYSWKVNGVNYMRNSVKVVIDAYDGTVQGYISEPTDPIIQSINAAFPGVLIPLESMPQSIRAHLRYPEDLFRYQTLLYQVYHMTDPRTYYNREDQWQIPTLDEGQGPARSPFLRHIVMRLPGEDSAEFIFMTPYTPRNKDNLAAWMVVRNDGEHYGELVVYRFPKQSLVFGPRQVVNRINQDPEIARQLSLWDQASSTVIRGQLLVIPVEESLIYVQPLYLRAAGGQIPELKRVVVAYQNRVVMDETLERALNVIFSGGGTRLPIAGDTVSRPGATTTAPSVTLDARASELIRQLQQHYDRAMAAQKAGNWAEYGSEIQRVGEILRQLAGGRQ